RLKHFTLLRSKFVGVISPCFRRLTADPIASALLCKYQFITRLKQVLNFAMAIRYNYAMLYRTLLLALLAVLPAKDPKWFQVSSEHFLLFTDTSEAKGKRLVSDFENRIAAFSQAFGKVPPRQFAIEIFLFNEEADFIEALPRIQGQQAEGENQLRKSAYMLRGPDRIFILAKDKSPDDIA